MENVVTALLVSSLEILLPVALTALAAWATAWFSKQRKLVEVKLTAEQMELLSSFAAQMVVAAEQSGMSAYIKDKGRYKYAYAYERVNKFVLDNKIPVDADAIRAVIEAAVLKEFNWTKAFADTGQPQAGRPIAGEELDKVLEE